MKDVDVDKSVEVEERVGCSAEAQEDDPGACSREPNRQLAAIDRPRTDVWTAQRGKEGHTIQSATDALYRGDSADLERTGRPGPASHERAP